MGFDFSKNNGGVIAQQLCRGILLRELNGDQKALASVLAQVGKTQYTLFEGPYSMTVEQRQQHVALMTVELVYVMQLKTKYPGLSVYELLRNVFKDVSISSKDTDEDIYTPATPLLNFIYSLVMADHASLPSDQVNRLLLKCDCDPASMNISGLVVKLQPNEAFFETCVEVALICP